MKKTSLLLIVCLFSIGSFAQKFENLAKTPPMGWNSWNKFATNINESLIMEIADAFIDLGLKDAGYEYIVLDDGWMAMERDSNGDLVADPEKFPRGMKFLADYIHGKGLKFGLYNCAGNLTCAKYPGSRGNEYQDARLYASWDVDFLKYDWCNTGKMNAEESFITMRDALYAAGNPVLFNICEWGSNEPWKWGAEVGHMWRTTGDIYNCFSCDIKYETGHYYGILPIISRNDREELRRAHGAGHWNDPDMLQVGNGMSLEEDKSHFALWAIMAAPLFLGNDLRDMPEETLKIITNKDIIAVNQDTLGIQGFKYKDNDSIQIWVKPLVNDEWAVCVLNAGGNPREFTLDWKNEKVEDTVSERTLSFSLTHYKIRDLFIGKEIGTSRKPLKLKLEKHQSYMYRLCPVNRK